MRKALLALPVVALSACATLPWLSAPPHYDYSQQALIGPGYPIGRIARPQGFELFNVYEDQYAQKHATGHGIADVSMAIASWVSETGDTAFASGSFHGAAVGSYYSPTDGSDGYEFVGRQRFQYTFEKGRYHDIVFGGVAAVPENAPTCATAVSLVTYSRDRRKRVVFDYAEGIPCDRLAMLFKQNDEALKQRAYRAFGIR